MYSRTVIVDALVLCPQAHSACLSDCKLSVKPRDGETLRYDFSSLSNVTTTQSSPRFTNKGLKFYQQFSIGLCGEEVCVSVSLSVCQYAFIPSHLHPHIISKAI